MPKPEVETLPSINESPFAKLGNEVNQSPELRKHLIVEIEQILQAKVVTYFTSFYDPDSQIVDVDVEMLESVLASEPFDGRLVLVVNSPGGQALAAERMVGVCRAYSNDNFEVLVPHMAKSAATMICLGANKIHMSKTAELGPVDPQIAYQSDPAIDRSVWISAEEYIRSYDNLVKAASGDATRIEPFLQQLSRFDDRFVEQLRSLQRLSTDISVRLLKSGMMHARSEKTIKKAIDVFLSQARTSSHGRMINYAEAQKCGLNIELIELNSNLYRKVWELYTRTSWVVTNRCRKLMETSRSALHQ